MLKLIIGLKGTGKTKAIIEDANKAVEKSRGSVICIEYGKKLTFDIKHQIRLIDCLDYDIRDGKQLYGFVGGLLAGNYDITDLFIDSALKICQDNLTDFEEFIITVDSLLVKNHINCVITASMAKEQLSEKLVKLV
ncbi:MAG: hypothetical protein A2Y17_03680 [Clostridiales bacterium GWF2_38_85]|nr:MAG: hypothetical protein A2Y17_03680 [Clostridiales bacterium GWF2_38_85]HBL85309.1 hypothetical protein [Clostridiales bacterium]